MTGARILYIDLTSRIWESDPVTDEVVRDYIGGRGINARLLYDFVPAGIDPLGPDNVLILGVGLLAGTDAPSAGRTTVTAKSPATGRYSKSSLGGHWGALLRYSGYEHVVLRGQAEEPVILHITDEGVRFLPAKDIWGTDVRQATEAVRAELGDGDAQVLTIGPAGENLVRFAAIMGSIYNAAGRTGLGAVLGSKKVKAIAVSMGSNAVRPALPERWLQTVREASAKVVAGPQGLRHYGTSGAIPYLNELRALPAYNFTRSHTPDAYRLSGQYLVERGYLKGRVACFGCSLGCHRFVRIDAGPYKGAFCGGPEYETMSALGCGCGITDPEAVIRANELCNIYGLDTISTGAVIQWVMESIERGALSRSDCEGLDIRWGNPEAVVGLIERIAHRRGIGDLLADGVRAAAAKIGRGSERWAVESRGLEQSRVETRVAKAYALAFAVNPRGPDHLHSECLAEFGNTPERRRLVARVCGSEEFAVPHLTDKKPELVRWHEDCYASTEAIGMCVFLTTAAYVLDEEDLAGLASAFLGREISAAELMLAGRRIVTLERCFNVREGAGRGDDTLPWRLMNEESQDAPGLVNSEAEMNAMLERYYELHGWDSNGRPTPETLRELNLDWTAKVGG